MIIWAMQDEAMTRIRVQPEPLTRPFPGWERRMGSVPDELYEMAMTSADDVEIETAHQDMWALLTPID